MKSWVLIAGWLSIAGCGPAPAAGAPAGSYRGGRVQSALGVDASSVDRSQRESIRRWLADKHFVLVTGFLDEQLPGVFSQNIQILKDDFGFTDLTLLLPSSKESLLHNAKELARRISELHGKLPAKKLVVLTASKGGVEAMLMLLLHPDWVSQEIVHRSVLIQATLAGTPLADFITPDCDTDPLSLLCQVFNRLPYLKEGLASLTAENVMREVGKRVRQLTPAQRRDFEERVLYVRAKQTFWNVSNAFKLPWLLVRELSNGAESDGMVLTQEQYIPGLGTDLGVLHSDHAGLFGSPFLSNQPYGFRQAFMWSLMELLRDLDT